MLHYLLLFLCASYTVVEASDYNGFKVYEIVPETISQCDLLHQLSLNTDIYDFFSLKRVPKLPTNVMVDPAGETYFLRVLKDNNLKYNVVIANVSESIAQDRQDQKLQGRLTSDRYYTHEEINDYIEDLARRYPSRAFVKTVGKSYEGRLIKKITVTNGDGRTNKKVIFVDGGMHAREWIGPAEVLYLLEQIVEKFEENAHLLQDYDWVVLPVINPDGYDYSLKSSRMWRKTRKPYQSGRSICYGADPNRNFGFHWNENGASDVPCDETFAGPKAFSEPETTVLRDVLLSLKNRGIMYLTLHSYGNYLLYPWGYTSDLPETWQVLDEVAQAGASAIYAAAKRTYTVGSSTNVLYEAAGGSDDYAFSIGFPVAITMELPAGGLLGFHPPTSRIHELVSETWIGIRAMAEKVIDKFP